MVESVRFNLKWHNIGFEVVIDNEKMIIIPEAPLTVCYKGDIKIFQDKTELRL